jgi:GNAT superfamily N-acetyltransferase
MARGPIGSLTASEHRRRLGRVRPSVLTRFPRQGARRAPEESAPAAARVRPRGGKDLAPAVRLLRLVHFDGRYPVQWPAAPRAWLADGTDDAWVAERRGEILGHVAVAPIEPGVSSVHWREMTGRPATELLSVTRLFVRPGEHGQGIGTALLDTAVQRIRSRGRLPVTDVVSASSGALALFEHSGWRLLDIRPWGPRGSGLRLHCFQLPPGR